MSISQSNAERLLINLFRPKIVGIRIESVSLFFVVVFLCLLYSFLFSFFDHFCKIFFSSSHRLLPHINTECNNRNNYVVDFQSCRKYKSWRTLWNGIFFYFFINQCKVLDSSRLQIQNDRWIDFGANPGKRVAHSSFYMSSILVHRTISQPTNNTFFGTLPWVNAILATR